MLYISLGDWIYVDLISIINSFFDEADKSTCTLYQTYQHYVISLKIKEWDIE